MLTKTNRMMEIKDLSTEELKQLLAQKEKEEKAERLKKKAAYEEKRDKIVKMLMMQADDIHYKLKNFKELTHRLMEEQAIALEDYSKINKKSKGGFSITDSSGQLRITRRRDTEPFWDERGNTAVAQIKDFLVDTVKKKDLKTFEIMMSFMEKNKAGDLEYSRVFLLLQHEDKYDDPRWVQGLQLLRESYSVTMKGYGYEFKVKTDKGWETLPLNFSSL